MRMTFIGFFLGLHSRACGTGMFLYVVVSPRHHHPPSPFCILISTVVHTIPYPLLVVQYPAHFCRHFLNKLAYSKVYSIPAASCPEVPRTSTGDKMATCGSSRIVGFGKSRKGAMNNVATLLVRPIFVHVPLYWNNEKPSITNIFRVRFPDAESWIVN
jgi:hypothetical protein